MTSFYYWGVELEQVGSCVRSVDYQSIDVHDQATLTLKVSLALLSLLGHSLKPFAQGTTYPSSRVLLTSPSSKRAFSAIHWSLQWWHTIHRVVFRFAGVIPTEITFCVVPNKHKSSYLLRMKSSSISLFTKTSSYWRATTQCHACNDMLWISTSESAYVRSTCSIL